MVAPVTGPFTRTQSGYGPPTSLGFKPQWLSRNSTWYRQKRPYNLPLTYQVRIDRVTASRVDDPGYTTYSESPYISLANAPSDRAAAYNAAYAKFKGGLGDNAALSVSLAERHQAVEMIAKRAGQLTSFAGKLRKLDFPGAAKALGLAPSQVPKGLRRKAKAFGNNYLEFHFGWSPLVADIGNAVDVLQGGVPPSRVSGRGKISSKYRQYWNPQPPGQGNLAGWDWTNNDYKTECKIVADISVSDPNLWLANSLGFVNPATVAWELVPYSFVVDWFVNVSDFLSGYTDMLGLSITRASTTFARNGVFHRSYATYNNFYSKWITYEKGWQNTEIERSAGIGTGPSLRVRQPWRVSPRRGLAAISLLLQKLR
jgi:hypothetical protein